MAEHAARQLDVLALLFHHSEFKFPRFGTHNKGAKKHLEDTEGIISMYADRQGTENLSAGFPAALRERLGSMAGSARHFPAKATQE